MFSMYRTLEPHSAARSGSRAERRPPTGYYDSIGLLSARLTPLARARARAYYQLAFGASSASFATGSTKKACPHRKNAIGTVATARNMLPIASEGWIV